MDIKETANFNNDGNNQSKMNNNVEMSYDSSIPHYNSHFQDQRKGDSRENNVNVNDQFHERNK